MIVHERLIRLFESEIAFVITNKSLDIARDIAGITSIRGCKLRPIPRLRITDTYYDTCTGLLGKKKIGLRTRRVKGKLLISMKTNPQRMARLGLRRDEFESPWSHESLEKVRKTLRFKGLPIGKSFRPLEPSRVLSKMGLLKVQERHTIRDARDILRPGKPGAGRIAELDIDRVKFLGNPEVRIFEIEIEAKARGSLKIIQRLAAELESNYSGFLRVWPHGKLVTGLAIQRLYRGGELQGYLENGRLKPQGFDIVDTALNADRVEAPRA